MSWNLRLAALLATGLLGLYALGPRSVELTLETEIDAPADEVWAVLAHRFAEIDEWSPTVKDSVALTADEIPGDVAPAANAPVPARTTVTGPGVTFTEVITDYSDDAKQLTFAGTALPFVLEAATDTQSVVPLGPDRSKVVFEVEMRPIFLLKPVVPVLSKRVASTFGTIQNELKTYVEGYSS